MEARACVFVYVCVCVCVCECTCVCVQMLVNICVCLSMCVLPASLVINLPPLNTKVICLPRNRTSADLMEKPSHSNQLFPTHKC